VSVTASVTTTIGGIFIAPTIAVDKSQVKRGDTIAIFGQTTKNAEVTIQVNSEVPYFAKSKADMGGIYLYNFDTSPLEYGDHTTKSKSAIDNEISSYSAAVGFAVGNQNISIITPVKVCTVRGDVNKDCKVNLVDFSILAYWFKRLGPPALIDLNSDGRVDLIDFSIMAYGWTG
jgi:hypothetical protein